MNGPIPATNRFLRFARVAWITAWVACGVPLLVAGTDFSKSYYIMVPVWMTFAPWVWPRFSFIGLRLMCGYTAMLCVAYLGDPNFNFYGVRHESYSRMLMFGSLAGLVVGVFRQGLGPDSPIGERIWRTAVMTLVLLFLFVYFATPRVH